MTECVPLMTGTEMSHNSGILASMGNPLSHVQADGKQVIGPDWLGALI